MTWFFFDMVKNLTNFWSKIWCQFFVIFFFGLQWNSVGKIDIRQQCSLHIFHVAQFTFCRLTANGHILTFMSTFLGVIIIVIVNDISKVKEHLVKKYDRKNSNDVICLVSYAYFSFLMHFLVRPCFCVILYIPTVISC